MAVDVFKILKDLEYRVVGIEPGTQNLQKGFFVSFRPIGLPIRVKDYEKPLEPFANNINTVVDVSTDVSNQVSLEEISGSEGVNDETKLMDKLKSDPEFSFLRTFVLSNDKIRLNNTYMVEPASSTVSGAWEAIINGAEIDLSNHVPNAETDAAFKELEKLLTPEIIDKYDKAQKKVDSVTEELVEKYTESRFEGSMGLVKWQQLGKNYIDKRDRAIRQRNIVQGDYIRLEALLSSNGIDPAAFLISKAKSIFESMSIVLGALGRFPFTFMTPSDWYDPDSSGWTKYTQKDYSSKFSVKNSQLSVGGGGGINLGFWRVGADAKYDTQKTNVDIVVDNLEIEFSYMVARVNRPWLDTSLLSAKNWFIDAEGEQVYDVNCISDGSMNQVYENKPNVFLPCVITSLILAKDVKISWKSNEKHISTFNEAIKAGASVGYGPFTLGGSYGKKEDSRTETFDEDIEELSTDGVQLIGYVAEILPASPFLKSK